MDFDAQNIVVGGVSAFVLLLFLVQTVKEALSLEGKYIPVVAAVLGVALMLVAAIVPEYALVAIAQGLALAAAVSLSVRYVKEAPHGKDTQTFQGDNVQTPGYRSAEPIATPTGTEQRYTGVRNLGKTEPFPHYQEDEWSGD